MPMAMVPELTDMPPALAVLAALAICGACKGRHVSVSAAASISRRRALARTGSAWAAKNAMHRVAMEARMLEKLLCCWLRAFQRRGSGRRVDAGLMMTWACRMLKAACRGWQVAVSCQRS